MKQLIVVLSFLAVMLSAPYAMSAEVSQPIPQAPICFIRIDPNIIRSEVQFGQYGEGFEGFRFTYGTSIQAIQGTQPGGAGRGRIIQEPITITKIIGTATPHLYKTLVTGKILPRVEILFPVRTERGPELFFSLKLEQVSIVNIKQVNDGPRVLEDISFLPTKIEMQSYRRQQDGKFVKDAMSGYDWAASKAN